MTHFDATPRNRVRRLPDRAHYDPETIYAIIDEAIVCHVGFVQDGQPFVIPTQHARSGDSLFFHGATTSRLIKHIGEGLPVCITFTLLDGLVLAKSVFHHSINYRSVVLFGAGKLAESKEEKLLALEKFTERLLPGRWQEARQPNAKELKATAVAIVQIESATAKIRSAPPSDDPEDVDLPVWAGVLPIAQTFGAPLPAANCDPAQPLPRALK